MVSREATELAERIYIKNASGEVEPLTEEPFATEAALQDLIAKHPELLSGEQMRPDDPLRWILIKREMDLDGWAVDHLLLAQYARPTLVEVKRGSNREVRRTVVGQMLDYAATASAVWSNGGMRSAFEQDAASRGVDPLDELGNLLQPEDEADPEELTEEFEEFWGRAATNLAANRLRLLFVADDIPTELERVVKFLNENTKDSIDVLAVEVKQYPGQFGQAIVSRVIGQTVASGGLGAGAERSRRGRRHRMSCDEFLEALTPDVRAAAEKLIRDAQEAGGIIRGSPGSIRIGARCPLYHRPINVAQFYPPTDNHEGQFTFRVKREFEIPELQAFLLDWVSQFESDDFVGKYAPTNWQTGWTVRPSTMVEHVDILSSRLRNALAGLATL